MMKIFILIVVAILIFLAGSFLYPIGASFILSLLGMYIADSRIFHAITNSLALITSIVWIIWYYKYHVMLNRYKYDNLQKVVLDLEEGVRDEALWLQAKIDADKLKRSPELIYAEYRLREGEESLLEKIGSAIGLIIFIAVTIFIVRACNA